MRTASALIFTFVILMAFGMLMELHVPFRMFGCLAIALMLTFIVVLAHEIGHAFTAHRLGAVVVSIAVMIFHLHLSPRKWSIQRPAGRGDLGGYVTYTVFERWWTTRKDAQVAFAGPAANFALALLAGVVAPFVSTPTGASIPSALAVVSLGMGISNLIPFKGSDGATILQYLRMRTPR